MKPGWTAFPSTIESPDQEPLQQSGVPDASGEIVDAQSA